MRKVVGFALSVLFGTVLQGQVTVLQPIPQVASIDVIAGTMTGVPIPRTLFGTFLEPIGNSTYNGLWAELLQNPSFEAGLWSPSRVVDVLHDSPELVQASRLALPLPWEPLDVRQGNRYELNYGDAANSWQSLRVLGVPGQPTGIKQKVYLPIHRTRDYTGSLYARHPSGATQITVSLRLRDQGDALASQQIDVVDASWKKYSFSLLVPEGKLHRLDPADFVIEVDGDERVELDQVSLMPTDAIAGLDSDEVAMPAGQETAATARWREGPRGYRLSRMCNSC